MHRKVVLQGPSTLVVSLPSKWIKEQGVTRGDSLSVNAKGSTLEVSVLNSKCDQNVLMEFDSIDPTSIFHNLRYLYRSGVDSIEIRFKENKTVESHYKSMHIFDAIKIELNRLMGMEIIEQSTHSCTLKCMVKEDQKDFDIFFRKIFQMMKSGFDTFCNYTIDYEKSYKEVMECHDTTTRFISYCYRLLNKFGHITYEYTTFYRQLLEYLELTIDIMEESAKNIKRLGRKPTKEIKPYIEKVKKHFIDLEEILFKFDIQKVHVYHRNRDTILNIEKSEKKFNSDDFFILGSFQIMVAICFRNIASIIQTMKWDGVVNK